MDQMGIAGRNEGGFKRYQERERERDQEDETGDRSRRGLRDGVTHKIEVGRHS